MRFLLTMDLEKVTKLLATGIGDRGRLEHIKKTLEDGKPLYDSDKRYLQNLINENSENLTSIDTTLDESETVLNSDSLSFIIVLIKEMSSDSVRDIFLFITINTSK